MYNKIQLIVIAIVISLSSLFAQEEKTPDFSVSLGLSVPARSFGGKTDFSYQGFANPGLSMGIDYSTCFWNVFGINFKLCHSNYSIDQEALKNMYNKAMGQESGVIINTGKYTVNILSAGPMLNFTFSKVNMQFKINYGISFLTHPSIKATDYELGVLRDLKGSNDFSKSLGLGASFNYWISDKQEIRFSYDIVSTEGKFCDKILDDKFNLNMNHHLFLLGYLIKL